MTRARLRDVSFTDCRVDGASFRMAELERVRFDDTMLAGADFTGISAQLVRFTACDLTGADVTKAKLKGTRLHGSVLDALKGGSSLTGVVIDSAQVLPVAHVVLASMGITVDDDRDPPDPR